MKRLPFLSLIIAVVSLIVSSCKGGNGKAEESDSINIVSVETLPTINEVVGIAGDGTSMNVLELIDKNGDTVYINAPESSVAGGINVGDEIDIIYTSHNDENLVTLAVNKTSLSHLWTQRFSDGHKESLQLDADGKATTYGMSVEYERWFVKDGLLLLQSPKKIGSETPAIVDTFEIMSLDEENLVLSHGNLETIFECAN